jgi:predicted ATPase
MGAITIFQGDNASGRSTLSHRANELEAVLMSVKSATEKITIVFSSNHDVIRTLLESCHLLAAEI